MKPLCFDVFCGLGGWAEGFLAEGYDVIGFDIERRPYPAQLVLQDVQTLDGAQFRNAACIVASPPCQAYSYRAMPWKRARALPPPDNALFDACWRIQREACAASGRYIPLVVENVRGAQRWVGRAAWHYGSYYLWGDVPALMPFTFRAQKVETYSDPRCNGGRGAHLTSQAENLKRLYGKDAPCGCWEKDSWHRINGMGPGDVCVNASVKGFARRFEDTPFAWYSSRSEARKQASAEIARIPFDLAQWIARVYKPEVR